MSGFSHENPVTRAGTVDSNQYPVRFFMRADGKSLKILKRIFQADNFYLIAYRNPQAWESDTDRAVTYL
jgi:hypothetical protein